MAYITINNAESCKIPVLLDLTQTAYDTVMFHWDPNTVNPGNVITFQYSTDNINFHTMGTSTDYIGPVSVTDNTYGQANQFSILYYRIITNSITCSNKISNVINRKKLSFIAPRSAYPLVVAPVVCSATTPEPPEGGTYDALCTASATFNLATITNTATGFVRLVDVPLPSYLIVYEHTINNQLGVGIPFNINTVLRTDFNAPGNTTLHIYPDASPPQVQIYRYKFEYSENGTNNWVLFYLDIVA